MTSVHDLGPLPKIDRNDDLETLSDGALQAIVPRNLFRYRSEPGKDRGVDRYLEARIGNYDTNCRAVVQLKATDKQANGDGSYSIQIDVSNLNYMMNGPCPLYIAWASADNGLRVAYAVDEQQRLELVSPGWRSQESITIRFSRLLTIAEFEAIHGRILAEAKLQRQVKEIMAAASHLERVTIEIKSDSMVGTNPLKLRETLLSSGMSIVSSGFANEASAMFDALNPADRRHPRLLLVKAYADYTLGRYYRALGSACEAALDGDGLEDGEQYYLDVLRNACEFHLGHRDRAAYDAKNVELAASLTGVQAAIHRLEQLRREHLAEADERRRTELRSEIVAIAKSIESDEANPLATKIHAALIRLNAEGQDWAWDARRAWGRSQLRAVLGRPESVDLLQSITGQLRKRLDRWQSEVEETYKAAQTCGNPTLTADALYVRAAVAFNMLHLQDAIETISSTTSSDRAAASYTAMRDLEIAIHAYSSADMLDSLMRAKVLMADFFELLGQRQAVENLAAEVIRVSEAMSVPATLRQGRDLLDGNSPLQKLRRELSRPLTDEELHDEELSDDTINGMATDIADALGLDAQHIPNVTGYFQGQRQAARERRLHCRHLKLVVNQAHEEHTQYRQPCAFGVDCELHRYRTIARPGVTFERVIDAFKGKRCVECPDRTPRGS